MNDMLANFVTAIKTLSEKAAINQPVATYKLDDTRTIVTFPDGSFKECVPIYQRDHILLSVAEIPEFVKYHIEQRDASPVVWVSDDGITVTLNDSNTSTRQDQAVYRPIQTREFSLIDSLNKTCTQVELIELVRIDLFGCLDDAVRGPLLKLLRKVKWSDDQQSRKGTVVHEVETGESSLTDEAGNKLSQFPDFVVCTLPVIQDTALKQKYEVRLHLSVDPVKKNFHVRAVDADVHEATQESLENIRKLLADVGCPVFLGQPTNG